MKKNNVVFYIFLFFSLILSGCLKEDGEFKDGGNKGIIELSLPSRSSSTIYQSKTSTIEVEDSVPLPITINYTGVNGALSDVNIKLEIDAEALQKYNDSLGKSYTLPGTGLYSFSPSVTIKKGEKTVTDTIWLYTKLFDLSISYALPVTIQSTTSGIVSGNYGTGIYILPVKSPWEGKYEVTINWDLSGTSLGAYQQYFPETIEADLTTSSPGIVQADDGIGDLFSGTSYYQFKPDGTIIFTTSSSNIKNIKVLESSFDLDTHSFHHKTSFTHPSYGDFILEETYKQEN